MNNCTNAHTESQCSVLCVGCSSQLTPKPFISKEKKIKMRIARLFLYQLSTLYILPVTYCHGVLFSSHNLSLLRISSRRFPSLLFSLVLSLCLFFHFAADKQKDSGLSVACSTWKGKKAEKHSTGCGFSNVCFWVGGSINHGTELHFEKQQRRKWVWKREQGRKEMKVFFFVFFLKVVGLGDE